MHANPVRSSSVQQEQSPSKSHTIGRAWRGNVWNSPLLPVAFNVHKRGAEIGETAQGERQDRSGLQPRTVGRSRSRKLRTDTVNGLSELDERSNC